jgi:predicted transcriptional regulator
MKVLQKINTNLMYIEEIEEKTNLEYHQLRPSLTKLMLYKLIDVEAFHGRTLYKLTDEGKKIVEARINRMRNNNGDIYGQKLYIHGILFEDATEARKHVQTLLKNYNDGNFLSTEDFEFIFSCLVQTEKGRSLIEKGILNIQVKVEHETYFLNVITDTDDYDIIPVLRLLGERKKYFHKKDVKKAFYNAVDFEPPYGYCIHNDEPHFSELYKSFFKETKIEQTEIEVERINNKEEIIDDNIRAMWVAYHTEHANVRIVPESEVENARQMKYEERMRGVTNEMH